MTLRISTALSAILLIGVVATSAEETTVALTVSAAAPGDANQRVVAQSLLALLEADVSSAETLSVVERMQIDLILQELVIDRTRKSTDDQQGQLGKLLTADLILTAQVELKESEGDDQPDELEFRVVITIVDALTGTVRGRTIAEMTAITVDDAAAEIAQYLQSVIQSPEQAGVTLAIGAFESQGRFERLRPLETGLKDLIQEQLLQVGHFRIVRRTDMKALNEELRLMRSGLADASRLPRTLPNRSAAFLLRGTIDERTQSGERRLIVEAELVNALSEQVVHTFRLDVSPKDLPNELSARLEELSQKLAAETKVSPAEIRRPVHTIEAEDLLLKSRRDLERFVRTSPIDGRTKWFSLPGSPDKPEDRAPLVKAGSPLGRHLLFKSIDRLESALYIKPDLAEAVYALGFCYSYHLPGIFQPERAEQLLTGLYKQNPEQQLAAPALWLLSEIQYVHDKRTSIPADRDAALREVMFAFEHMPASNRNFRWAQLVEQISRLGYKPGDSTVHLRLIGGVETLVHQSEGRVREVLAENVARLVENTLKNKRLGPQERSTLREVLVRWTESDQPSLPIFAAEALADLATEEKDFAGAAEWFQRAADRYLESHNGKRSAVSESLLIRAARQQRLGGDLEASLKLLDRIDSRRQPRGHLYSYGMELGLAYEALGDPERAREIYITAAETVPSITRNTDVVERIRKLGGVSVRDDRDVDVTYIPPPEKLAVSVRKLATDGQRLFCATAGRAAKGADLLILDLTTRTWSKTSAPFRGVTGLACNGGPVWVGTGTEGIWQYSPQEVTWMHWSTDEGLPDDRVISLALDGRTLYAGVGTESSGGLIKIAPSGRVMVLDGPGTPKFAPTHIALDAGQILARTRSAVHRYDRNAGEWSVLEGVKNPKVFSGETEIWASDVVRRQLYPFRPNGTADVRFRKAWSPANGFNTSYFVNFVLERNGQIWFGGPAVKPFLTTGLYRFDLSTGEFILYGPRDGFGIRRLSVTYDAVWAADRLWVADGAGLAAVKIRLKPE